MERKDLTEYLESIGEETVVLEPEYLDNAIIGISDDNRLIYGYEQLIDCFSKNEDMTYEEAIEWVDYNTLRALPYMGAKAPIINMPLPLD